MEPPRDACVAKIQDFKRLLQTRQLHADDSPMSIKFIGKVFNAKMNIIGIYSIGDLVTYLTRDNANKSEIFTRMSTLLKNSRRNKVTPYPTGQVVSTDEAIMPLTVVADINTCAYNSTLRLLYVLKQVTLGVLETSGFAYPASLYTERKLPAMIPQTLESMRSCRAYMNEETCDSFRLCTWKRPGVCSSNEANTESPPGIGAGPHRAISGASLMSSTKYGNRNLESITTFQGTYRRGLRLPGALL